MQNHFPTADYRSTFVKPLCKCIVDTIFHRTVSASVSNAPSATSTYNILNVSEQPWTQSISCTIYSNWEGTPMCNKLVHGTVGGSFRLDSTLCTMRTTFSVLLCRMCCKVSKLSWHDAHDKYTLSGRDQLGENGRGTFSQKWLPFIYLTFGAAGNASGSRAKHAK